MKIVNTCATFLLISLVFFVYRDAAIEKNELIVLSMAIQILRLMIYAHRAKWAIEAVEGKVRKRSGPKS